MADGNQAGGAPQQTAGQAGGAPQQTAGQAAGGGPAVDYRAKYEQARAHMREWEKRAKENAAAAEELEKLKAARMSETELLQKQLDEARSEASSLRAEKERRAWVAASAAATGVPTELLDLISAESAEDLMEKAESLRDRYGSTAGAQASQTVPVVIGDGRHADIGEGGTADAWLRSTLPGTH